MREGLAFRHPDAVRFTGMGPVDGRGRFGRIDVVSVPAHTETAAFLNQLIDSPLSIGSAVRQSSDMCRRQ